MHNLISLTYKGKPVRRIDKDGMTWWVLSDVCAILGLGSIHKVAARLDEDERNQIPVIDTIGRTQLTAAVNESGLYSVLLRSDKPEAKPFKRWVTHEVLPSIRRTGQYIAPTAPVKTTRDMAAHKKEMVYNTPRNAKAQKMIAQIRQGTAALLQTVELYNRFIPVEKAEAYQKTMTDYGYNLASITSDLARLPIEQVESDR